MSREKKKKKVYGLPRSQCFGAHVLALKSIFFSWTTASGWSGGAKVSCILRHRGWSDCAKVSCILRHRGWSDGAKVSCILRHRGVQLMLAYSWARPVILVAGNGRGGKFLCLLHFHSCSSFFPVPLFNLFYYLFYLFSLSLGDDTK